MTTLTIPDKLAERLQDIANQENRPVEALLESLLKQYDPIPDSNSVEDTTLSDLLESYAGSLDTDITDLSTQSIVII